MSSVSGTRSGAQQEANWLYSQGNGSIPVAQGERAGLPASLMQVTMNTSCPWRRRGVVALPPATCRMQSNVVSISFILGLLFEKPYNHF